MGFVLLFVALFAGLVAAALALGAAVGVAIGVMLAGVAAAVLLVHAASAWLVWRSRPRTRFVMGRRWWSVLCVPFGPLFAMAYWIAHYRLSMPDMCNSCGYLRANTDRWSLCPECGTPFPEDAPRAPLTFPIA